MSQRNGELRQFGPSTTALFWDLSCEICHKSFSNGQDIARNICNHSFHQDCVENWWREVKSKGKYYLPGLQIKFEA